MNDVLICTDNPNNFFVWKTLWQNNAIYFKHHVRLYEWALNNNDKLRRLKYIILDRFTGNHDAVETEITKELKNLGFNGLAILSSYKHECGEDVPGFDFSIGSTPVSKGDLEKKLWVSN